MATSRVPWVEPDGWPDDAERERVIGDWYMYQRRGGHRSSTDDVVTAWLAAHRQDLRPERYLDLGCGIGSVLLMTSHRLRPRRAVGVEAQPQSVAMATRSVAELPGLSGGDRPEMAIVHSDFRSFDGGGRVFDLITGSPPYFPLGTGSLPDDAQRRACRFEARGGVEAYCETAARHLAEGGRFCFVFQTTWDIRVLSAITESGLHLSARADLKMRSDRAQPFLTVYECRHESVPTVAQFGFAIRDAQGEISSDYSAARRELGVDAN